MVLYSNRDDDRDLQKKEKRRDTWCPGNLLKGILSEGYCTIQSVKPRRPKYNMGPLLPFEELADEAQATVDCSTKQNELCNNDYKGMEECCLPDPRALLHVTNRRKGPVKDKSSVVCVKELVEMQAEYEELLLHLETERTINEVRVDCLMRNLAEANLLKLLPSYHSNKSRVCEDHNLVSRDSEAIRVIKQLQEQIRVLEFEKSSSQQNLDCVVELATEQNICARDNYEAVWEELLNARKETAMIREQLISKENDENLDSLKTLLVNVQEILFEVQGSKKHFEDVSSLVDELFECVFASVEAIFEFKSLMCQSTVQVRSTINNYEKVHFCLKQEVTKLENEKICLVNQSGDLITQIEELKQRAENSERAFNELVDQQDQENSELFSHIRILEKDISCLSSSSLAKEKESLRKDLDKTKAKLKDTESKLKNVIQEKTKLEGEKAFADREIKQLLGQKSLLERDNNKRESIAGRRRDSIVDRSYKVFDPKKAKGCAIPFETVQEDYKHLEVLAFEMETTIASLEEQLAAAQGENKEAISRHESLALEQESLLEKLNMLEMELFTKQEEISSLSCRLEESDSNYKKLENSLNMLVDEKEELATQLSNALMEIEEEKAIWSTNEKTSIEAMEEKTNSYNAELLMLKNGMLEVINELESSKAKCKDLKERLTRCEEILERERQCSKEKSLEIDQLGDALKIANEEIKRSQENLKDQLHIMTKNRDKLMDRVEEQRSHVINIEALRKSDNDQILEAKDQVETLSRWKFTMKVKMHNDDAKNRIEMAKVRMRLHWTDAKLNAVSERHKQAVKEIDLMNMKFEEAAANLKERLSSSLIENLNLKKQLAAFKG